MDDSISRQAAIDTNGLDEEIRCEMCTNLMHTDRGCNGHCKYNENLYGRILEILDRRIKQLPSAQPDLDEWCTDCKEYDQERHSCPRWNRVIRETLKDAQPTQRWIPCSERLPDIKEHHVSEPCIVYCENGAYGFAELEENIFGQVGWNCERDDEYHEPLGEVIAWMPFLEPYREVEE